MRIFIQMSVAGFKVFDINAFRHECENRVYALISEISSTQNSIENLHTHIIRNDMHGMRLETMRLFSSGDVTFLLHDDYLGGNPARCLFASKYSLTRDEFKRDCDVSLCLMSENEEDIDMINKFGYMFVTNPQSGVKEQLQMVLRLEIIDNRQVLLFDAPLWQCLCNEVAQCTPASATPVIGGIANGKNQVVVLGRGQDRVGVKRNMEGLFNDRPYIVLQDTQLPLSPQTLLDSNAMMPMSFITTIRHVKDNDTNNRVHEFISDIRNAFRKFINKE